MRRCRYPDGGGQTLLRHEQEGRRHRQHHLTGGCAKNAGLKQAIEHVLKLKVIDLKTDPQLMGALGAAEYARQKGMAKA